MTSCVHYWVRPILTFVKRKCNNWYFITHIYEYTYIVCMCEMMWFKNEWTDLTNGPLNRYYYNNATLDIGNYMLYSIVEKARYHYLLTWFKFSYVLFWFHFLQTMMIIKSHKRSIQTYILYVLAQYFGTFSNSI